MKPIDINIGFLTHLSRSGSTLLARLLDEYNDICVTTEGEFPLELLGVKAYAPIQFPDNMTVSDYLTHVLAHTRVSSWELSDQAILTACNAHGFPISGPELVTLILKVYRDTYKPEAGMVIYKACPFMPWHIPASLPRFPEAAYIHLLRDPRAVFHSQLKSLDPFTGKPYSTSAMRTAMDWKKAAQLCDPGCNERSTEVKFETLADNPAGVLDDVLSFLKIQDRSRTAGEHAFTERMSPEDKRLHQEINHEPDPNKNLAWESTLTERDIHIIEHFLRDEMKQKGYSRSKSESDAGLLFAMYLKLSLLKEYVGILLRRSNRVIRAALKNPHNLLRKFSLKTRHA